MREAMSSKASLIRKRYCAFLLIFYKLNLVSSFLISAFQVVFQNEILAKSAAPKTTFPWARLSQTLYWYAAARRHGGRVSERAFHSKSSSVQRKCLAVVLQKVGWLAGWLLKDFTSAMKSFRQCERRQRWKACGLCLRHNNNAKSASSNNDKWMKIFSLKSTENGHKQKSENAAGRKNKGELVFTTLRALETLRWQCLLARATGGRVWS